MRLVKAESQSMMGVWGCPLLICRAVMVCLVAACLYLHLLYSIYSFNSFPQWGRTLV